MEGIFVLVTLAVIGFAGRGSVKIVRTQNEALVEYLGAYKRKLTPGLKFLLPFVERVVFEETNREKVIDIPPQRCVTRDNVSIEVDAVVYWRIMDMEKAYYRVEDLRVAMENLVLTQVRAEMGQLELDQTFTARTEVNETLLRELDIATDPWGVKVTRVELRILTPPRTCRTPWSYKWLPSAASGRRFSPRKASENRGLTKPKVKLKRGSSMPRRASDRPSSMPKRDSRRFSCRQKPNARSKFSGRAPRPKPWTSSPKSLKATPGLAKRCSFILAQDYLEMGKTIGSSDSSKILFMDPRSMFSTLEGARAVLGDETFFGERRAE